ncbi:MAG: MepB family protein [Bacteroidetes bacterium]|nr:MepB family protein [Bacteroidota bacterium]NOG58202.1 MepB family protein [Bacteroidota bacterium]
MNTLKEFELLLLRPLEIEITAISIENESQEYDALQFSLNDSIVIHRTAKQTPKKNGQFVTCWRRNNVGFTCPFHQTDEFDFFFIQIKKENKLGLFIFPKAVLIDRNIVSTTNKIGKRGFRVYPPWDIPTSKQAIETQNWQLAYFVNLRDLDFEKAKNLCML